MKNNYQVIKLVHAAISFSQLIFLIVCFTLPMDTLNTVIIPSVVQYMIPVIIVALFFLSKLCYSILVRKASQKTGLNEKMNAILLASIMQFAALEMAGFVGCLFYLLTLSYYFLFAPIAAFILLILNRPTLFKIINDLSLSREEKQELEVSISKK